MACGGPRVATRARAADLSFVSGSKPLGLANSPDQNDRNALKARTGIGAKDVTPLVSP